MGREEAIAAAEGDDDRRYDLRSVCGFSMAMVQLFEAEICIAKTWDRNAVRATSVWSFAGGKSH